MHPAATHHTPPLLTLYSLSRDFNNFSVSSLQYLCIGVSRMGAHDGGMCSIRLSGKIESGLHASGGEFGRDARDTRETRNGDYRTVRSTVVRMPSLPPECLLVAAHASSLPPPTAEPRRAASDASGRPETPERARTHCPPRVSPRPSPSHRHPALPRPDRSAPRRVSFSLPPAGLPPSPQAALGRVRVSSHSVPLGALGAARRNGARTGGSLITPWRIT